MKSSILLLVCLVICGLMPQKANAQTDPALNVVVNSLDERDANQLNQLLQVGVRASLNLAPSERAPQSLYRATSVTEPADPVVGQTTCWRSDSMCVNNPIFQQTELERMGMTTKSLPKQNMESGFKFFVKGTLLPLTLLRGRQREKSVAPF